MAGRKKKNARGEERTAAQEYAEHISEARGLVECLLAKMARHEERFKQAGREDWAMVADVLVWRNFLERLSREG